MGTFVSITGFVCCPSGKLGKPELARIFHTLIVYWVQLRPMDGLGRVDIVFGAPWLVLATRPLTPGRESFWSAVDGTFKGASPRQA